jgi:hypothetical protein
VLTDEKKQDMVDVKDLGQALIDKIESLQHGSSTREQNIALIKAEEAVMWAAKHITK